jgi:hypothetical protein
MNQQTQPPLPTALTASTIGEKPVRTPSHVARPEIDAAMCRHDQLE